MADYIHQIYNRSYKSLAPSAGSRLPNTDWEYCEEDFCIVSYELTLTSKPLRLKHGQYARCARHFVCFGTICQTFGSSVSVLK